MGAEPGDWTWGDRLGDGVLILSWLRDVWANISIT